MLLDLAYWRVAWHIPPLNHFSTINSMSVSVNKSNFTSVFLKAAFNPNPGSERNFPGSKR